MRKYLIIGGGVLFFIVMIIAAVYLSGGGTKKNTEQVELTWWKTFNDRTDMNDLISAYEDANPNVTIKYEKKNINTYEQDLLNAIASGNSPDIFTIHNDWLPKHMDKMAPMPASMMTERQYKDAFVDVAAADFIKDGKIYAIPMSLDVLALYYNKDILGSAGIFTPPATWPQVVSAVQKITQQDNSGNFTRSGIAMGTSSNINRSSDLLLLLMLQQGTVFYNNTNTSATFNQQIRVDNESFNPGAMALDFYTQFARPSKKSYTWNTKADNSVDAFAQGKLAMMISYSYMIPTLKDKAPNLNWGVAPIPQVDTTGLKTNFANYWGEGVSKSSTHQEYAWDFLKFITQHDQLKGYTEKVKAPSSRKDLLTEQSSDLELGPFADNTATAKSVYKYDANQFEGIIQKMIDDVILLGADPEDAVSDAVAQVNLTMRK